MSAVPGAGADIPMMPMPVYPSTQAFMPAAENPHISKVPVTGGRTLHAVHIPAVIVTPQEPVQHIASATQSKSGADQPACQTIEAVDPNRLKFWNPEETVELIHLYKKYLPEFHKYGQRKMNVWQRVTEEMISKGYGNFSWAECSAKFRSLRDSYRRTTTGSRAHTWQYYPLMKDVMKMEKMILEQEPSARPQKGTITCENEIRTPNLAFANAGLADASLSNSTLPSNQQHITSRTGDGDGVIVDSDMDELSKKRLPSDSNGPAAKKPKDSDQDSEVVIGRNFNGELVKVKTKKPLGPMGPLGSLQALGKSLSLPQSQLVIGDDGQIVQTTSAPTGLFIGDNGQLCSGHSGPRRQVSTMPQWFKMYEKRTRAENNRRLEELKEMHQESLELQRQTLEVARQKNDLLKNLMESLAEFKSLFQR